MSDIIDKTINISGVKDLGVRFEIMDGTTKYGFWKNKKDGDQTKAFTQWQDSQLEKGKQVTAGVKEESVTFNKAGRDIGYTRRTILFFKGSGHETPSVVDTPEPSEDINPEDLPF